MTWRWPWVSRAAYELLLAERERDRAEFVEGVNLDHARWMEMICGWKDAHESLLARYHMLKLQGFTEPTPKPAAAERAAPDPVKQAIAQKFGSNRELASQAWQQVRADRAAGVSDDEIALRILRGVTTDDITVNPSVTAP